MRTIVTTKFYGPTNSRGSRVKVSAGSNGRSEFVSFNYSAPGHEGITPRDLIDVASDLIWDEPGYARLTSAEVVLGPDNSLTYWLREYDYV